MKKHVICYLLPVICLLWAGCSTTKVSRLDVSEEIDLSGYWNDIDSRLVAEAMTSDCLSAIWLMRFKNTKNKNPRVIVGNVINSSAEHIATDTFVRDIERSLVNSGKVGFVAGGSSREDIRRERAGQQQFSEEAKAFYKEVAADFILQGTINTLLDTRGGKTVRFYQVELDLIDIETTEKVWMGQKKIKKLVKKSKLGF